MALTGDIEIAFCASATHLPKETTAHRLLADHKGLCCNRFTRTHSHASMPFFKPTTFTTPRLVLRPLQREDVQALFTRWSDKEAMRFTIPAMTDVDQSTDRLARMMQRSANGTDLICAITLRGTGEVLGDTALFRADEQNRHVEIGFGLRRAHWGRGYMQEAASALIDHAFDALKMHRIEADIDPRNAASAKLLTRLGFVREGLLRERWFMGEEICDSERYGLLARDRQCSALSTEAR